MPPFEPKPWPGKPLVERFMPHLSLSKRGHNSRRDKRNRWYEKHPASGFRPTHGRQRGR